jgi:hypothetical protein
LFQRLKHRVDDRAQVGTRPAFLRENVMRARMRHNAGGDGGSRMCGRRRRTQRLGNDGLDGSQNVLDPVVQLRDQKLLLPFTARPLCDIRTLYEDVRNVAPVVSDWLEYDVEEAFIRSLSTD